MAKKKKRGHELKRLMNHLISLVTDEMLKSFNADRNEWEDSIYEIQPDSDWVEFCPFVLMAVPEGWELADGDPICNWCCNTFTERFPRDVETQEILDRMLRSVNEELIVTDKQFREHLDGHIVGLVDSEVKPDGRQD